MSDNSLEGLKIDWSNRYCSVEIVTSGHSEDEAYNCLSWKISTRKSTNLIVYLFIYLFFNCSTSLTNWLSCVFSCDDLLCIYFFIPHFKDMKFIYSPFIFIFPGYVTNQFKNLLQAGLIAQLIRALHRYRRGQESNPVKLNLFQAFFSPLHKLRI